MNPYGIDDQWRDPADYIVAACWIVGAGVLGMALAVALAIVETVGVVR